MSNYEFDPTHHLKAGGFAEIFKAEQSRPNRSVALKRLKAKYAKDKDWCERFEREANAVAKVKSVHVVIIHGVEDIDGHTYMVMEWINGQTLHEWVNTLNASPAEKCRIALGMAQAIADVHKEGVVHRDITPANVMIRDHDNHPVLIDFGLSWVLEDGTDSSHKREAGTLFFMPPEAWDGHSDRGREGDVYGLGVVMFYLFTGMHYLLPDEYGCRGAKNLVSTRLKANVKHAVLQDEPRWDLLDGVYAEFKPVLSAMLAKDPQKRSSAQQVFERISSIASKAQRTQSLSSESASPSGDYTMYAYAQHRDQLERVEVALVLTRDARDYQRFESQQELYVPITGSGFVIELRHKQHPDWYLVAECSSDGPTFHTNIKVDNESIQFITPHSHQQVSTTPPSRIRIQQLRFSEVLFIVDASSTGCLEAVAEFAGAFERALDSSHPLHMGLLLYGEYVNHGIQSPLAYDHAAAMGDRRAADIQKVAKRVTSEIIAFRKKGVAGALELALYHAARSDVWGTPDSDRHVVIIGASPPTRRQSRTLNFTSWSTSRPTLKAWIGANSTRSLGKMASHVTYCHATLRRSVTAASAFATTRRMSGARCQMTSRCRRIFLKP